MKTITIKPRTPLDQEQNVRILYGVRICEDVLQDRVFDFRINAHGRQVPWTHTNETRGVLTFRVEKTLDPGDSIFFTAENGPELRSILCMEGKNPDAVTIGAFWQVQEDGSLICTGT